MLHRRNQSRVAFRERRVDASLIGPVVEVVHAEHDGDHIRVPRKDIAIQTQVDRAGPSAANLVAAHSGVVKVHLPSGVPGQNKLFDVLRIFTLFRDAVAIKCDAVSVVQGEVGRCALGMPYACQVASQKQ